jgi:SAM-dependent methyltransferase
MAHRPRAAGDYLIPPPAVFALFSRPPPSYKPTGIPLRLLQGGPPAAPLPKPRIFPENRMKLSQSLARSLALSCLAVTFTVNAPFANGPTPKSAQQAPSTQEYVPQPGQEGKDVIWLPTAQSLVDRMLDLAKVTPNDVVIDLGSGDGRTVITAAKRGAKALGIEYNPKMVEFARRNAEKEGVGDKAQFRQGDIFETDFSSATVLTMFLLPSLNRKLRPTVLDMKPGTRVVSNSFDMGDWTPDVTERVEEGCSGHCTAHFWVVPAKVQGAWKLGDGELMLEQQYQMVGGSMKTGGGSVPISDGKLVGEEITFTAGGTRYTGRVNGDVIEGTSGDAKTPWRATRG